MSESKIVCDIIFYSILLVVTIELALKSLLFLFFRKVYLHSIFYFILKISDYFDRKGKNRAIFVNETYPSLMKRFSLIWLLGSLILILELLLTIKDSLNW
jgi:hypothetical protein